MSPAQQRVFERAVVAFTLSILVSVLVGLVVGLGLARTLLYTAPVTLSSEVP